MNINSILLLAGCIMAFILYPPLIYGILCGKTKQNLVTWMLWVSLDVIALVSIILQGGNYWLLIVYCVCGAMVVLSLVYTRQFGWTSFETLVLVLVFICLVVWYLSGHRWATIASTVAVCIAGCPQIRESWRNPDRTSALIYTGYMLANGLTFLGGKAWTIEDRFYPGMMTLLCFAVAIAASRKKGPKVIQIHISRVT